MKLQVSNSAIARWHCRLIISLGRDTKFAVFHFLCTVMDFSARTLPIGVKFCMAVWPDLVQVFYHLEG